MTDTEKPNEAPEVPSGSKAMLGCPFCGASGEMVDLRGWYTNDGKYGPQCLECGATAESNDKWNMRKP